MKTIYLIGNCADTMRHFRRWLIDELMENNYQCSMIAPRKMKHYKNKSFFRMVSRSNDICRYQINILRSCIKNPLAIFISYTLIGNFSTAAWSYVFDRKHVAIITGVGSFLYSDTRFKLLLIPVLRRIYSKTQFFVFMNDGNRDFYIKHFDIPHEKCLFMPGEGIDPKILTYVLQNRENVTLFNRDDFNVVYIGRLLKDKGLYDIMKIAAKRPGMTFHIFGSIDQNNPSSLTPDELLEFQSQKNVFFYGHRHDAMNILAEADIVLLPSYHEGFPTVLSEALSLGKMFLTTDAVGCVDFVNFTGHGETYPIGNIEKAVEKLDEAQRNLVFYDSTRSSTAQAKIFRKQVFDVYRRFLKCI